MITRNAEQPNEKRIVLRIGINVGDIIIDGGDIFGDGVNVAARLVSTSPENAVRNFLATPRLTLQKNFPK
ncbi:MAG: adenylate cyclase [Bradyrhizobium sp.]|nr:adenylate cyclase [Bradyrhizobium sp.]